MYNRESRASVEAGARGEDFAAAYLREQGYRVVARNFHSRYGEIDLIAVDDRYICFVEVKTRSRHPESGAEAVGAGKQRKIITTALGYMQKHPEYDLQPRFDVLRAEIDRRGGVRVYDYIMGAFDGAAYR